MSLFKISVLLLSALLVASCVSSQSASVYRRDQAQQTQHVEMGRVEHVRSVLIEGTKSSIGLFSGALLGGIGGSTLGQGRGSAIFSIIGAIAGGAAGAAAEEGLTRTEGLEITVKLDSGAIIAIVQKADEVFSVGERVRVVTEPGYEGKTRVTH